MPTPQTLITPYGLRISLPGVDVTNPPALTEDYLAIDWSWQAMERLHAKGKVLGSSLASNISSFTWNFSALAGAPISAVIPMTPGDDGASR